MTIVKLSRFELLKIWGRYRLGERRSDMAKEFGVSNSLIYTHMRKIDRIMKRPYPNSLSHYCLGGIGWRGKEITQSNSPGRLPEGFGRLDPANDKQMGTILPLELFQRIEAKVDGVVFRNRSQIVRTALIEWLDRDLADEKDLNAELMRKADRILKGAVINWLKARGSDYGSV